MKNLEEQKSFKEENTNDFEEKEMADKKKTKKPKKSPKIRVSKSHKKSRGK